MREKDELVFNTVAHDGSDTYFLGTGDIAAKRLELQNAALLEESKKHIEKIPVLEGKVIWDIGCGSGAMTAYFAEKVGETGHVYAIDISEKQLEVTKKRIEKDGFTNVTFIHADIVSDSFPTNAADIVYMRFVLMHLCNPNQALDKIKDLLKPQGMFISEEPINSSCYSPTDANAILKEYISAYVEMGRRRGVNYDIGSCLDNTLNKAGFANTEVTYTLVKIDAELGKTMLPMFLNEWKDEAIRTEVTTEERVVAWKETISHLTNSRQLLFGHAYTMARAFGQKSESSLQRNEDDVDTTIIPEDFFRSTVPGNF